MMVMLAEPSLYRGNPNRDLTFYEPNYVRGCNSALYKGSAVIYFII